MTTEQIQERLRGLIKTRDEHERLAILHEGAIKDCEWFLQQLQQGGKPQLVPTPPPATEGESE